MTPPVIDAFNAILKKAHGQAPAPASAVKARRVAPEVLRAIVDPEKTTAIRDHIKEGRLRYGMQTFAQHPTALYQAGTISPEVANAAATSPADFGRSLQFQ